MRLLRCRDVKWFAQSYMANKWQSQGLNSGQSDPRAHTLAWRTPPRMSCALSADVRSWALSKPMWSHLGEPFENCLVLCRCKVSRLTFFVTSYCPGTWQTTTLGGGRVEFQCGSCVGVPGVVCPWYDEMMRRPVHQKRCRRWWLNPDWIYKREAVFCPYIYSRRDLVSTTSHIF